MIPAIFEVLGELWEVHALLSIGVALILLFPLVLALVFLGMAVMSWPTTLSKRRHPCFIAFLLWFNLMPMALMPFRSLDLMTSRTSLSQHGVAVFFAAVALFLYWSDKGGEWNHGQRARWWTIALLAMPFVVGTVVSLMTAG